MFGSYLEAFLRASSAAAIIEVFIWMMLCIFGIALALGLLKRQPSQLLDYAPSVLVFEELGAEISEVHQAAAAAAAASGESLNQWVTSVIQETAHV